VTLLLMFVGGSGDAQIKYWDGAAWVKKPLLVFDGANFVPIPKSKFKYWDGAAFVPVP
jgi:hypothetical protein